ncbi:Laccase domain protein in ftsZ 3'region [Madurella mycetomatis]|uniref:Laccase domain protein in ftsZ 3'region n=1 Tax=Madurella mycetomatis TaxID=100816 RepID=A0A175WFQ7_9PEZI|nr:Laccase domain protein in ftsZ 3'region [Madurella mycetomatis]
MEQPNAEIPQKPCDRLAPIYDVFQDFKAIRAVYTGKGTNTSNRHFSFHLPSQPSDENAKSVFRSNLEVLAQKADFNSQTLLLPNGGWPHSGVSVRAEDYSWHRNETAGILAATTSDGIPLRYDAITTRKRGVVLAAQGADCPSVFLFDPIATVIGIAHSGWKPLVRGVLENLIKDMASLGAKESRIVAFVAPGAGDKYNCFGWDERMETEIRTVFETAGRRDLLSDQSIRHRMTEAEQEELSKTSSCSIGNETFMLSKFAVRQLLGAGILPENVSCSPNSTILDCYERPGTGQGGTVEYKYHSYRREKPNHGLGMSIIFIK